MATDVQTRSRTATGTPAGGQFATEARTEPTLTLAPGTSGRSQELRDTMREAARDVEARGRGGLGDPDSAETVRLRLRGIAAGVRAHYPDAASIGFECSDQPGCDDDYRVVSVLDANGEDLTGGTYFDLGEDDDTIDDLGYDMPGNDLRAHSATSDINDRQGTFKLDIDGALAAPAPEPASREPDAGRATDFLAAYAGRHAGHDQASAARALAADLEAWAQANDVQLARPSFTATAEDLDRTLGTLPPAPDGLDLQGAEVDWDQDEDAVFLRFKVDGAEYTTVQDDGYGRRGLWDEDGKLVTEGPAVAWGLAAQKRCTHLAAEGRDQLIDRDGPAIIAVACDQGTTR